MALSSYRLDHSTAHREFLLPPAQNITHTAWKNGLLNIFNWFIAMAGGLLCDRVGRRPLFIISTIGEYRAIIIDF